MSASPSHPLAPVCPQAPHPQRDLIPKELRARPQWFCWRYKQRNKDQFSKVPINPCTGGDGKPNAPTTCGTFVQAWTRYNNHADINGIGFLFTPDDDFAGVDLDDCRDPETGTLEPWAAAVVHNLNSYTEVSPSGTGVKIFLRATKGMVHFAPGNMVTVRAMRIGNSRLTQLWKPLRPCLNCHQVSEPCPTKQGKREREGQVEIYDRSHYFTVTGHHLPGTPRNVEKRQEALNLLYAETFSRDAENTPQPPMRNPAPITNLEDHSLLKRASTAQNGPLFTALFKGDTSAYGGDRSRADMALCGLLAF